MKAFFVSSYRRSCKGLAPTKTSFQDNHSLWRWRNVNCGRFMGRRARILWWWRRLFTVCVLMWPPNTKLPRSAPAVLNGRCRAHLDMSYLLTCEPGYWSIFIYMYMTGCVKCHVYFSTFVFANESWLFLCRILSFIFYWFGMVRYG
jgi:hypothetical protein